MNPGNNATSGFEESKDIETKPHTHTDSEPAECESHHFSTIDDDDGSARIGRVLCSYSGPDLDVG